MAKKRGKKGGQGGTAAQPQSLPDRRANERMFADIRAAMQGQNFESPEQANRMLQAMVAAGGPPRAEKMTPLDRALYTSSIVGRPWKGTSATSAPAGPEGGEGRMATYVLVQGGNMSTVTWNRLTVGSPVFTRDGHMGARYWDGTVSALRARNHRVFAPELKDENTCHLADHIDQVCSEITENDLRGVILVGHSYGGMIITGVAARMPERIRRLVYLDAALPDPGQSLYDLIHQALSASPGPHPVLPEPAPPYVEKLQFDPAKIKRMPKTYILCTKSEFIAGTRIAKQKIAAAPEGWTYRELPSSHVPMADMPEELYRMLLDAGQR